MRALLAVMALAVAPCSLGESLPAISAAPSDSSTAPTLGGGTTSLPPLMAGTTTTATTAAPTTTAASANPVSPAVVTTEPAPVPPEQPAGLSDGVVRAAFYYGWFPQGWKQQGYDPFTMYQPAIGYYSSSDVATIAQQIASMQYGHLDAGILSWWGQGTRTDQAVPLDLQAAAGTPWKWTLYYEAEGSADPGVGQIQSDLAYIADRYVGDPSYLHLNGKPVIFVYGDPGDSCGMSDRWAQANAVMGFYVVLKVFSGYRTCGTQPDSWHQYGPAKDVSEVKGHSYSVSPGFDKPGESGPRLERDPARFEQSVQAMVASGQPLQLVTTFNEWGEGTSVENANEWASASGYGIYLDILHAIVPA